MNGLPPRGVQTPQRPAVAFRTPPQTPRGAAANGLLTPPQAAQGVEFQTPPPQTPPQTPPSAPRLRTADRLGFPPDHPEDFPPALDLNDLDPLNVLRDLLVEINRRREIPIGQDIAMPISSLPENTEDPISRELIDPNDAYVICTAAHPNGTQENNCRFYSLLTLRNLEHLHHTKRTSPVDPYTRLEITQYKKVRFVQPPQRFRSSSAPGRLTFTSS